MMMRCPAKKHQLMHEDINDDTNANTDGPLRIHGTTGDPTEPPELGPIRPPPTPCSPLPLGFSKSCVHFCKGVGSLAKRPAAIS